MTLARDAGFTVVEQQIAREMLYIADEVFFTGTAAEITPIRSVDRIVVGAGPAGTGHRAPPEGLLRPHPGRGAGSLRMADAAAGRGGGAVRLIGPLSLSAIRSIR